ncbi:MAG: cytidylate kinase-like family protein [Deltaproteobacteria bacterium]|nr:cytidylate kinase-like family protein [Deltaproteobacteria bacterium]
MQATKGRTIEKMVEEQIHQWQLSTKGKKRAEKQGVSVITVSRQPGSQGDKIAAMLAESLGFTLFGRDIMQKMAESAHINARILETVDEKGLNLLEESIATLIEDRHLWPDQYLKHLMKVISTIARHGKAVIIGRGAHFILRHEQTLCLRIIAPRKTRIKRLAGQQGVSEGEARRMILKSESDRHAFSRKYFYADIDDPENYDLILNTGKLTPMAIISAVGKLIEPS